MFNGKTNNIMLKIGKLINQYRKSGTGNIVLVYDVVGGEKELATYKEDRMSVVQSEEAAGFFYSSRPLVEGAEVFKTQAGNYSVKSDLVAEAIRKQKLEEEAEAKYRALMSATGATTEQILAAALA